MARNDASQNAANYVRTKGIDELFEAMMTALMVKKPDDHINFIRQCLDKIGGDKHKDICWDYFLKKSCASVITKQHKSLPPIRRSKPIIFILSNGSMSLCSRLLKRYPYVHYLSINDIGNIEDDEPIDLSRHKQRFDSMRTVIDERYSSYDGFLLAGELNEQYYLEQWRDTFDRIDLVIVLTSQKSRTIFNTNVRLIQINSNDDLEDIVSICIRHFDRLFPHDAFVSQRSAMISVNRRKFLHFPVLFCLDTHQIETKQDDYPIDNEENNYGNSFISTLCQRLSDDLTLKYIQYGNLDKTFLNFDQLQSEINQLCNYYSGFIIAQFPTSLKDLHQFESEFGPCALLICIGSYGSNTKFDEIIEKFQFNDKAIYVDSQMEVDEIYDDVKQDILKHL